MQGAPWQQQGQAVQDQSQFFVPASTEEQPDAQQQQPQLQLPEQQQQQPAYYQEAAAPWQQQPQQQPPEQLYSVTPAQTEQQQYAPAYNPQPEAVQPRMHPGYYAPAELPGPVQPYGQPHMPAYQAPAANPWDQGAAAVPAPWGQQPPPVLQPAGSMEGTRIWIGTVTEQIPPNYGIVDGEAFFVNEVVSGRVPQLGEKATCEAVPNTDGGMYKWRCLRVEATGPPGPGTQPLTLPPPAMGMAYGLPPMAAPQPTAGPRFPSGPITLPSASTGFMIKPGGPIAGQKVATSQAAPKEPAVYNSMAPPTTAYTAEVALALASNAIEDSKGTVSTAAQDAVAAKRAAVFSSAKLGPLDEEAQRRVEAATKQLATHADPSGIGIKLLAQMGFGAAGIGLGKEGQGISKPVEAKQLRQGTGLGFEVAPPPRKSDRRSPPLRRRRSPPPPRRGRERDRHRSDSRSASRSQSRSRTRSPVTRYRCDPPKFPPFEARRGIPALSKRYKDLYIPSDFIHMDCLWLASLPERTPYPLTKALTFKIAKGDDASSDAAASTPLPPSDASKTLSPDELASARCWSAKIVLVAGVTPNVLQSLDKRMWQHPGKKLQFLMGRKGKSELMLIGGAWEPCDGGHPEQDPSALIATAVRTFRAATGMDLSACTQWFKFGEYSYLREASKDGPERVETTQVFLVDSWRLAVPDIAATEALAKAQDAEKNVETAEAEVKAADDHQKEAAQAVVEAEAKVIPEPVFEHDIELQHTSMTVAELQSELTKRGLETKWNPLKGKKELQDRLQEWIDARKKERDDAVQSVKAVADAKAATEKAAERVTQAQEALKAAKAAIRTSAKLLEDPPPTEVIEVVPNKEFLGKKERFAALALTLDGLLDYTVSDTAEQTFEVSLFAEAFRDMLHLRFGRALLRGVGIMAQEAKAKKEADKAKSKAKKDAEKKESSKKAKKDADKDDGDKKDTKKAKKEGDKDVASASREKADTQEEDGKGKEKEAGGKGGATSAAINGAVAVANGVPESKLEVGKKRAAEAVTADDKPSPKRVKVAEESAGPPGQRESFLLACRWFDRDCAGYLEADDVEEIIFMVSDSVSRRRCQNLVDAVIKRKQLSYMDHAGLFVPPAPLPAQPAICPLCLSAPVIPQMPQTPANTPKGQPALLLEQVSGPEVAPCPAPAPVPAPSQAVPAVAAPAEDTGKAQALQDRITELVQQHEQLELKHRALAEKLENAEKQVAGLKGAKASLSKAISRVFAAVDEAEKDVKKLLPK